ncbi:MAG TPA: hypothetical protein VJK07_03780 [Candidatus Nanoarchaeia archaeon]|nr:hypothetical protein [Candidatus Nanoarchaeia archaeon]
MAKSWVAQRYRFNREFERLLGLENISLSGPGEFIPKEEAIARGFGPSLHPSGGWYTGWGGRGNVPLSYQFELADDRHRKANRLAGRRPTHNSFEEFFAGCFTAIAYSMAGAFTGSIAGYTLSENHPVLMTLGGLVSGAITAPVLYVLGKYLSSITREKIYNSALKSPDEKKTRRLR